MIASNVIAACDLKRVFQSYPIRAITLTAAGIVALAPITPAAHARGLTHRNDGAPAVIALLSDGLMVLVDAKTTTPLATGLYQPGWSGGRSVGFNPKTDEAFVSTFDAAHTTTRVFAVNIESRQVRLVASLTTPKSYSWLDVGQQAGRVFLVGDSGNRVLVLDGHDGKRLASADLSMDSIRSWLVYRARVAPDEKQLYLSYHGGCIGETPSPCTTGVDWVSVAPGADLRRCSKATSARPNQGCALAHGDFAPFGTRLIGATGTDLAEFDSLGASVARFDVRLPRNHLMEFALDTVDAVAYMVGPCSPYAGGVSATPLRPGAHPRSWENHDARVCGSHVALSSDRSWLVIGGEQGDLLVVSTKDGSVIRRDKAGAAVVDLLSIGRR